MLGEFFDNTEETTIENLEPGEVGDFEIWFENADLEAAVSYSLSATGEVENGGQNDTATPGETETSKGASPSPSADG